VVEDLVDKVRAARRELDQVIEEIRAVPGYEGFLAPPTFADVAAVAGEQPLVYLAAAEPGGLALIVRGEDVEHVDLPELSLDAVHERVGGFLDAYEAFRGASEDPSALAAWSDALDEVTAWLWPASMGPMLERWPAPTSGTDAADTDAADAAVFVAGGLLGLLPLHAAWTPDETAVGGRRYALDAISISYAPNARSLAAARSVAERTTGERLLAVADPQPQPARVKPLRLAGAEAACAAAGFGAGESVTLAGAAASVEAVRRALAGADVLHFACHGSALLHSPLDSHLLLAGGELLTLRELLGMRMQARMALLPACETSRPGTDLPDEVVSLPTGLLQAGVAGVVATLWAVDDPAAAMVMAEFYRCWRWEGMAPAHALRRAQLWVRDTSNAEKISVWEQAQAAGAGWLPPSADALVEEVMLRDDWEAHGEASLPAWGAFVHVGA
jgi:CHAT domain-containing protein